jgi:hypothetical protein
MIIHYDDRATGTGKTRDQLSRICANPGVYLFAVDRREVIAEREASLLALAKEASVNITTRSVHTPIGNDYAFPGSVRVEIEGLPNTYATGHVLVWITHAGLKSADLSKFEGWHLVIDETPSLLDRDTMTSHVSRALISSLFDLEPNGEFSRIVSKADARHSTRAIATDTVAGSLGTLHACVTGETYEVVTHLRNWDELTRRPRWTWWSFWSPAGLAAFESVTILAAAFDRSLTYELCRARHPEIGWQRIDGPPPAAWRPRTLTIRSFAHEHVARRNLFGSVAGKEYITAIAAHLRAHGGRMIWTCNKPELPLMRLYLPLNWLSPRQAGSNAWVQFDTAAIIYTSKPDQHECRLLAAMGIDPARMIETRERETIYQFASRTSIRDRDSDRDVVVYVYDHEQAAALQKAFAANPALTVRLELVDLGFAYRTHGRSETDRLSPAQKAERRREQARNRQRAKRQRDRGEQK